MAVEDTRKILGRPRKAFHGRRVSWGDCFLWIVPGILIPALLLSYGLLALYDGYAQGGAGAESAQSAQNVRLWFSLAGLAWAPFAVLSTRRFRRARRAVIVHQEGLRLHNIPGSDQVLLWPQINGIRTYGTRYHLFGRPLYERFAITIEPVHGRDIRLEDQLENLPELAARVKHSIYPLLLPDMAAELKQGKPVVFGPIRLEKESLTVRGRRLPWPKVRSIRVDAGRLVIKPENRPDILTPSRKIPNIDLLLMLATQLTSPQTARHGKEL